MKPLALAPEEERARLVLEALKSYRGMSDAKLAGALGVSRPGITARRSGATKLGLPDIVRLAPVLGVEPTVFLMTPSAALRWVLDHEDEMPDNVRQISSNTGRDMEVPSTIRSGDRPQTVAA